jgi:hypothetical protein
VLTGDPVPVRANESGASLLAGDLFSNFPVALLTAQAGS